jgi:2-(3-amino-3-carboxypropyl)histidine synthase
MEYDFELKKIEKEIQKTKAKNVLLQLPDGLKPHAIEIVDYLEKNTKANIIIWLDSCFGACDLPLGLKNIDLLVHFGHSKWKN